MDLRETAAVASFLLKLASVGIPVGEAVSPNDYDQWQLARNRTIEMVRIILTTCVEMGSVVPCGKQKALRYLTRHTGTYLNHPYLDTVKRFVESFELPSDCSTTTTTTKLMSKSMQRVGSDPRLPNDLSERISVAYSALTDANVPKVRRRIADALQNAGIERRLNSRSNGSNPSEWDDEDVYDRVKKFEQSFFGSPKRIRLSAKNRTLLSQHWINIFRHHKQFEEWIKGASTQVDV